MGVVQGDANSLKGLYMVYSLVLGSKLLKGGICGN